MRWFKSLDQFTNLLSLSMVEKKNRDQSLSEVMGVRVDNKFAGQSLVNTRRRSFWNVSRW
jgi:hypothetical protein